jgi:proline dehydrogenase
MIGLATNAPLAELAQRQAVFSALERRFVGGTQSAEAVAQATELKAAGKLASLFYLGEYVDQPALVEVTVAEYERIAPELAKAGLDVHLSIDPTAVGSMISWDACRNNVFRIARAITAAVAAYPVEHTFLMLDMEDSGATEKTIRLYEDLRSEGLPAAVTLQAYLNTYEKDLGRCIAPSGAIRLVKGAFAEPRTRVATDRAEIDRRYRRAALLMLSTDARAAGFYPIFATHDVPLIRDIRVMARASGWAPGSYEFEMLYGVRPRLQDALVARGERLRLYLPYGKAWWPYALRRVGENPRNVIMLARAFFAPR